MNLDPQRIRTWLNLQQPDLDKGKYDAGYPHVHHNEEGITLVIYLDPGDASAPLDVLTDDLEITETITPEVGKVVVIPNGIWHAVHKNRGQRDRVALIVTGYDFGNSS